MKTRYDIQILRIAFMGITILLNLSNIKAQEALTLDKALQIAETGSPDLQLSSHPVLDLSYLFLTRPGSL